MRESVGAVRVPRDVVRVSGNEATAYLQGQLSQDVAALEPGGSAWSFALQPQGKVDAWFRVSRVDDDFVLDVDEGAGSALTARLERFKLRTEVQFEPLGWAMVALRGPLAAETDLPDAPVAHDPGWPGIAGVDVLGPGTGVLDAVPLCELEAYEWLRIEAGVPAMGRELTEEIIPAESGVVERSVSFTKGCFTGQELVARIDSRGGNVPRHLRGLVLSGDEPPEPGSTVRSDDQEVGSVTSSGRSPALGAATALAYVKRAVEPGATVSVGAGGSETTAQVCELPIVGR